MTETKSGLSDHDLSKEELLRQFCLSMAVFPLFRHDVLGRIPLAEMCIRFLQSRVQQLQPGRACEQVDLAELEECAAGALKAIVRLRAGMVLLDRFGRNSSENLFVSNISKVVAALSVVRPGQTLAILPGSPSTLEVVYPPNILFGVLLELTENAIGSSDHSRQIVIGWGMRDDRFECEVHDDGPGIRPDLGNRFVPLGELGFPDGDADSVVPSGLSILERIAINSGGMLLFSRSSLLGGTAALFQVPVVRHAL